MKYYLKNNLTGLVYPQEFDDIDEAARVKHIENSVKHKKFFPDGKGRFEIHKKYEERDLITWSGVKIPLY